MCLLRLRSSSKYIFGKMRTKTKSKSSPADIGSVTKLTKETSSTMISRNQGQVLMLRFNHGLFKWLFIKCVTVLWHCVWLYLVFSDMVEWHFCDLLWLVNEVRQKPRGIIDELKPVHFGTTCSFYRKNLCKWWWISEYEKLSNCSNHCHIRYH